MTKKPSIVDSCRDQIFLVLGTHDLSRLKRFGEIRPGNDYFQGGTGGTVSVAGGAFTEPKSAGETISRYSMSEE